MEIYSANGSLPIGPVFLGKIRFDKSNIGWELGLLKETDARSPGRIVRLLFE